MCRKVNCYLVRRFGFRTILFNLLSSLSASIKNNALMEYLSFSCEFEKGNRTVEMYIVVLSIYLSSVDVSTKNIKQLVPYLA